MNQWAGTDIASTALTDATNQRLLDASAGHVWQVSTGTNLEAVVFLVNAVSPTGTATATAKAATLSAMMALNAQGLFQIFASPTAGAAGGQVSWGAPFFSVSPTGTTTAVVSASLFSFQTITTSGIFTTVSGSAMVGVSTPTVSATDGFLYIPRLVSSPTGTPTVQPGYVAIVATSLSAYLNPGGTATWTQMGATQAPKTTVFTGSGTYNPTATTKAAWVRIVGGGGGGGGSNNSQSAAGGGAGGYSEMMLANPTVQTVTIGGAGSAGASGGAGGAGGNSTFGAILTANGGSGGGANGGAAGTGGSASGGDVNLTGGNGGSGSTTGNIAGGMGSASPFGGAGAGGQPGGGGGSAAANTGSGGGGSGSSSGTGGGAGAAGLCVIVEFF